MYLFISFSSQDNAAVRELMSGLKLQEFDFWDYSDQVEAIEIGKNLPGKMLAQIDKADYFVILLSPNSMSPTSGQFVKLELEYAINQGFLQQNRILPLIMAEKEITSWPSPFNKLSEIKHINLDVSDLIQFQQALALFCENLGKPYQPIIDPHPRLPFWKLFRDEAMALKHSRSVHIQLMMMLTHFNRKFQAGEITEAYEIISLFIALARYWIPGQTFFYPWIVKSVCERSLDLWDEAEKSLREAEKVKPNSENAYGGLGSIYFHRKEYLKSHEYFKRSYELCPENQNLDEVLNYAVSFIALEREVPQKLVIRILQLDDALYKDERYVDERCKIINTQAILLQQSGRRDEAAAKFALLENTGLADLTTFTRHYNLLMEEGKKSAALSVLLHGIHLLADKNAAHHIYLYNRLANHYWDTGDFELAESIYKNKLLPHPAIDPYTLLRFAQFQQLRNHANECEKICRSFLENKKFLPANSAAYFYYSGYAHYLLGQEALAQHDYERCGHFDDYYSQLVQ